MLAPAKWPEWVKRAHDDMGVRETPGPAMTDRIREMWKDAGITLPPDADDAVWHWCAAGMNSWLVKSGRKGTSSGLALSFLKYGYELKQPRFGCIVVLKRGKDPNKGHVGILMDHDKGSVVLLGANQGNSVRLSTFPKGQVLAYRWPDAEAPEPLPEQPGVLGREVSVSGDFRRSWTLTGGLMAALAWLAETFQGALSIASEAANQAVDIQPGLDWLTSMGVSVGGTAKTVALIGLLIVITRRLQASRQAKVG